MRFTSNLSVSNSATDSQIGDVMNSRIHRAQKNCDIARILLSHINDFVLDNLENNWDDLIDDPRDVDDALKGTQIEKIEVLSREIRDLVEQMQDKVIS